MREESRIPNPYRDGFPALLGLVALTLILAVSGGIMVALGKWEASLMVPVSIPFVLFGLLLLIVWLLGELQRRRIVAFLASDRPLVRWTYTSAEWREIMDVKWEDEKGDWRIMWGCLTGLFGLVGLLVGLALAAGETSFSPPILDAIIEIVPGGLIGMALGALVGAAIGLAVAGGNYLALRRMHGRSAPGQVALGATEFYANGEYFRANGDIIRGVDFQRGTSAILTISTYMIRFRRPSEEEWVIVVPRRMVELVQEVIPQIVGSGPDSEEW
jgi:heme A synthase